MLILYSQLFANGCNTSYVDATVQAEGIIKWQKTICGKSEEKAEARSLLSMDDLILAEGLQSIYAFTNEGKELWTRRKWYGTPVVFYKGLLYFTSAERKSRMEAVDLSNQIHIRDFWMPNVVEDSYLSLFEPLENGLIAQVKFTRDQPIIRKDRSSIKYNWEDWDSSGAKVLREKLGSSRLCAGNAIF